MKLSAPIYRLKRQARHLSREAKIPLHEALDRVALREGYRTWSLLAAKLAAESPARRLFPRLAAGDLVLLGARPGQGKTVMSLELIVQALKLGYRAAFFTLEYKEEEVLDRLRQTEGYDATLDNLFQFDCSDAISAGHIIDCLASAPRATFVVIDYLQLLDQKRDNPELSAQVQALKSFAREQGLIIVCISQIDRSYDPSKKECPDIDDVRLPNPVDLGLFNKTCFLNNGEIRFQTNLAALATQSGGAAPGDN